MNRTSIYNNKETILIVPKQKVWQESLHKLSTGLFPVDITDSNVGECKGHVQLFFLG